MRICDKCKQSATGENAYSIFIMPKIPGYVDSLNVSLDLCKKCAYQIASFVAGSIASDARPA